MPTNNKQLDKREAVCISQLGAVGLDRIDKYTIYSMGSDTESP